jgi:hypothetical protein
MKLFLGTFAGSFLAMFIIVLRNWLDAESRDKILVLFVLTLSSALIATFFWAVES